MKIFGYIILIGILFVPFPACTLTDTQKGESVLFSDPLNSEKAQATATILEQDETINNVDTPFPLSTENATITVTMVESEPVVDATSIPDTPTPVLPTTEMIQTDYSYWNAHNLSLVLQAADLKIREMRLLDPEDLPGDPLLSNEAYMLDLSDTCKNCWGRMFFFDSPDYQQIVVDYYMHLSESDPEHKSWLIVDHNLLLQLGSKMRESQAQEFQDALLNFLPSSMLQPSTFANSFYESWDEYYPIDRGQQVDPERGMGQRTINRWQGENLWQFGQSTWVYQDPDGSNDPPPYYPSVFEGDPLTYYILYHCEEQINSEPTLDCLNWRMFIELLTLTKENTELHNWARGGWQWKKPKPITWEVYYQPKSFAGNCDKNYLRKNTSTEYLQDPSVKLPLIVRLPKITGVRYISPRYCSVFFRSYTLQPNSILSANLSQNTTELLEKTYDPVNDQYLIKAVNRYYVFDQFIDGEMIFRQEEYEIYWSRQTKADQQLRNGMEAFWWFTWPPPPEENRDYDEDPNWSSFQWCYQDLSQSPEWLGKLTCLKDSK
jgi:hypothetical protein